MLTTMTNNYWTFEMEIIVEYSQKGAFIIVGFPIFSVEE